MRCHLLESFILLFCRHANATITMQSFESWAFEARQHLSKRNLQAHSIWQNHVIYLQVFERIFQSQARINLIKNLKVSPAKRVSCSTITSFIVVIERWLVLNEKLTFSWLLNGHDFGHVQFCLALRFNNQL